MSLELFVRDVGAVAVGNRLAPYLATGVVKSVRSETNCLQHDYLRNDLLSQRKVEQR